MKKYFLTYLFVLLTNTMLGQGSWVWMHGDSVGAAIIPPYGVHADYGIKGIASVTNTPGSRYQGGCCTDKDGNFWLYGGQTLNPVSVSTNDLWKYDPIINMWTWVTGPQYGNAPVLVEGTKGIPSINNQPSQCTISGMMVCDTNNNLWLITGSSDNMLWRYTISTNEWTWMHGTSNNATANYGTIMVANPLNVPPAIGESKTMLLHKKSNTIWLLDNRKDMWKYDIATNEFTWMHGNHGASQSFGIKYAESVSNFLTKNGGMNHAAWIDDDYYYMQDNITETTWRYNLITNMWAWVAGNDTTFFPVHISSYNNEYCEFLDEVYSGNDDFEYRASNLPGSNYLWKFGGFSNLGMWVFHKKKLQWMWVEGGSHSAKTANHGIKGVANPDNFPETSVCNGHSQWIDKCGNIWTYGGIDLNNKFKWYNTMWKYTPDTICFKDLFESPFNINVHDTALCFGDSYTFAIPSHLSYTISPTTDVTVTNNIIEIKSNKDLVTYTLHVQLIEECKTWDTVYSFNLKGIDCDSSKLFIPNSFTPNGDFLNDVFKVIGKDIDLHKFVIYNRWGQEVYNTKDISKGWDGRYRMKDCEIGTYFYYVEYLPKNSVVKKIAKGDLILLR